MELNVVFGWHLDGLAYPETASGQIYDAGGLVVGPAGLAQHLCMRLGIASPIAPQAVRIARYMQALRQCDHGDRFYSRSFALDPWSTASCLLVMRDQLIGGGWNGEPLRSHNEKLCSLSDVEQVAHPLNSPAESTRELLRTLQCGKAAHLPIRTIEVVTPRTLLPGAWKTILGNLAERGVRVIERAFNAPPEASTDLKKIQLFLTTGTKAELVGDGSFCLLEADDEYQLSELTGAWLASSDRRDKLVIIRDASTTILDAYCSCLLLPRVGGNDKSRWRSALQALPLSLHCGWLPVNPYRILELIALPDGPIPQSLAYHFIQALRAEPGFGGQRWASAWHAAETDLRQQAETDEEDEGTVNRKVLSTLKYLRSWLEPKRFDPVSGMPADEVIAACKRVIAWASLNIRRDRASEMFLMAIKAAQELEATLIAAGMKQIDKIQLDKILDAVAGEGSPPEPWHAQAAEWALIDKPGQLWDSADSVCWWGFAGRKFQSSQLDVWTSQDRNSIAQDGVMLERPIATVTREAYSWRQPLLWAQNEILLCRPRLSSGEAVPRHPLWDELEQLIPHAEGRVIAQAHDILSKPRAIIGTRELASSLLEASLPPQPRPIWSAPMGSITDRSEESVSSMRELLGCPMAWVLRYYAQMHPGILLTLPSGDQLIGDIAHELLRALLQSGAGSEQISRQAGNLFDDLVKRVGLPLLLPGRSYDRESARRSLVAAAHHFSEMIERAHLQVVECEARRDRAFRTGRFLGDIDILLRDSSENEIVIDYKWTKSTKYRTEEIEKSQHLQLAAYAWLASSDERSVSHAGYYMLRQRRLLHSGCLSLMMGQQIAAAPLSGVWERAQLAYEEAMSVLNTGKIYACGLNDGEQAPTSSIFQLDAPCKFCCYRNICGRGIVHE